MKAVHLFNWYAYEAAHYAEQAVTDWNRPVCLDMGPALQCKVARPAWTGAPFCIHITELRWRRLSILADRRPSPQSLSRRIRAMTLRAIHAAGYETRVPA